jgi:hypothetical protein
MIPAAESAAVEKGVWNLADSAKTQNISWVWKVPDTFFNGC